MKTGYVYDPIYLQHDTGVHVENALRLTGVMNYLQSTGTLSQLIALPSRQASREELALVHSGGMIDEIKTSSQSGGGWLDPDTLCSSRSYDAALFAVGGTIEAVEAVLKGTVEHAFALVRPPGHHATSFQPMGFCLFNNLAIAAKAVLEKYRLRKIAIIDFDVHHGNGIQDIFYNDERIFYISTHQYPFFPGTGKLEESGNGSLSHIVNIPLPAGCGDIEYMRAFEEVIVPLTRFHAPELILVSAGYDSHWADPLAGMSLSTTGFAGIVKTIKELAAELCGNKMAMVLEGGYKVNALAYSVKATFDVLLGKQHIDDPLGFPPERKPADIGLLLKKIKEFHKLA